MARLHPFLAWLTQQLLIVAVIALTFTIGLSLALEQSFGTTLVYCVCISAACSLCAQGLHELVSRWVGKRMKGLPLVVVVTVGAIPGYEIGTRLADLLTGGQSPSMLGANPRQALLLLFLILLPCAVISYYFRTREGLAAAKAQAAEHQLQLLQAQLEPHMLFNTLANLRVLIGMDPAQATAMLDQLIAFLRATLQASRSGSHSLADEFARLGDYLALMQVRMQDRLQVRLDLPPDLAAVQVPPLLLQPLVENAIKHGLEPQLDGGELRVSARREGSRLLLEVHDTGAGLSNAPSSGTQFGKTRSTGFGTHQVRERLKTRYGTDAQFTPIAPTEGGALATITLPLS